MLCSMDESIDLQYIIFNSQGLNHCYRIYFTVQSMAGKETGSRAQIRVSDLGPQH